MSMIVTLYAKEVVAGRKKADEVPAKLQDDVKAEVKRLKAEAKKKDQESAGE